MQNVKEKKNYGVEWISEIPKEWTYLRNKYCFDLKKDIVGNESDSYQLLSLTKNGIKEIGKDEQNGKVPESFDTYQVVNSGDIVMCLFDLDVSAVFSGISSKKGIISSAYKCLQCKEILNNRYVDYYFRTVFVDRKYKRYSKNVRYSISVDEFMDLSIVVPPIDEQRSIADFLNSKCQKIDDTIEKINKQIEVLKKYKQSLITEVVTKGLDKNAPMKDSGVDWIGKIPKNWEVKRLKYIINSIVKGNGIIKEEVIEDGDTPCVRYGELYNKYNHSFDKCVSYTNKDIIETKQYFCHDSILFTCTGELIEEIGKSIVYKGNEECLAGGDILIVTTPENAEFINYVSNSYAQIQKSIGKAKLKVVHISAFDISNLLIAIPTIDEQNKIVEYLYSKCLKIDNILDKKSKQIEILERYKKSLIYEYVTGKKLLNKSMKGIK